MYKSVLCRMKVIKECHEQRLCLIKFCVPDVKKKKKGLGEVEDIQLCRG